MRTIQVPSIKLVPESKKARAFAFVAGVILLNEILFAWKGTELRPEAVELLMALAGAYFVGQGVADLGKGKVQEEKKPRPPTTNPTGVDSP